MGRELDTITTVEIFQKRTVKQEIKGVQGVRKEMIIKLIVHGL